MASRCFRTGTDSPEAHVISHIATLDVTHELVLFAADVLQPERHGAAGRRQATPARSHHRTADRARDPSDPAERTVPDATTGAARPATTLVTEARDTSRPVADCSLH
jgi:hypothetical protein